MKKEESHSFKNRIYFVDNLRIFLISLVVLHHLAITYGAPGAWFYNESQAEFPEIIPLSMFVATNQAFFMGMFFFISSYFITSSLNKKGISTFMKDRLIRLGIPILIFYFFLFPLTVFIRNRFILHEDISLFEYIFQHHIFGFGPMWFVEALLLFTVIYIIWRKINKSTTESRAVRFPGTVSILFFILFIGIGQFIIRIWLPVGWSMSFTEFQFPHFLQYILLFCLGITAYKNNWMHVITAKLGWNWFVFVQLSIFVGFPLIFILGGAKENGVDAFMGGINWKSFTYSIWEQMVGIGMIIALFGIFQNKLNKQGAIGKKLSASAYAVYVFHTPILLVTSTLFLDFQIAQLWKFVVLAPMALILSFGTAFLVKNLPVLRHIF